MIEQKVFGPDRFAVDYVGFGFRVLVDDEGYYVTLPHQCDAWSIASRDEFTPATRQDAIARLMEFIDEASEALTALEQHEWNVKAGLA